MEIEGRNIKNEQLQKIFRAQKREIRVDQKLYQAEIPQELHDEMKSDYLRESKAFYGELGFSARFLNSQLSPEEIEKYLESVSELVRDVMSDKGGLITNSTLSLQERALEFLHSMNYSTVKARFFLAFPTLLIYNRIKPLNISEEEMEEQLLKFIERMKKSKNIEYEKWKSEFTEAINKRIPLNKLHGFLETMKTNKFEMPESVKEPFEKVSKFSKEIKAISSERASLERLLELKAESESYNIVTSEMVTFEENVSKCVNWINGAETIFMDSKISWKMLQQLISEYKSLPLSYERFQELKAIHEESQKVFSQIPISSRSSSSKARYPSGSRVSLKEIARVVQETKKLKVHHDDFEELCWNLQRANELRESVRMLAEDTRCEKSIKMISNLYKELAILPYKTEEEDFLQDWVDYLSLIEKVKKNMGNYQKLKELVAELEETEFKPEYGEEALKVKEQAIQSLKWFSIYNSLVESKKKRMENLNKSLGPSEDISINTFPETLKMQEIVSNMIDEEEMERFLMLNKEKVFYSELSEEYEKFLSWKLTTSSIYDLDSLMKCLYEGMQLSIVSPVLKSLIERFSEFKSWRKKYSKSSKSFKDLKDLKLASDPIIISSPEYLEVEEEFQKAYEWKVKAKQILNGDYTPKEIEDFLYNSKGISKPLKILEKLEEVLKSRSSFQEIHELVSRENLIKSTIFLETEISEMKAKIEEFKECECLMVDQFYDEFGSSIIKMLVKVKEELANGNPKISFSKANKINIDLKKYVKTQNEKFSNDIGIFQEHYEAVQKLGFSLEDILKQETKKKGKKINGVANSNSFEYYFKMPKFIITFLEALSYPIEVSCLLECTRFLDQIEGIVQKVNETLKGNIEHEELLTFINTRKKHNFYTPQLGILKKLVKWIEAWRLPAQYFMRQVPKPKLFFKNKNLEKEILPSNIDSEQFFAYYNDSECSLIISHKSKQENAPRPLFSKRPRKQNKSLQDSVVYTLNDDPFGKPRKKNKLLTSDFRLHNNLLKEENFEEKYCICRKGHDGLAFMIQCDYCYEWFHGDCVSIKQSAAKKMPSWNCVVCFDRFDISNIDSKAINGISFELFHKMLKEGMSLPLRPVEMNEFEELFQAIEKWVFLARKEIRQGIDYQNLLNDNENKRNEQILDLLLQYNSFPVDFPEYSELMKLQRKRDFLLAVVKENAKALKKYLSKDLSYLELENDSEMELYYQRGKFIVENFSSKKIVKIEQLDEKIKEIQEWETDFQNYLQEKAELNLFKVLKTRHASLSHPSIMYSGLCEIVEKGENWVKNALNFVSGKNRNYEFRRLLIEESKSIPCKLPFIESIMNPIA